MIRTTDPRIGARESSRMPTYICEGCSEPVWDEEVCDRLGEISREDSLAAVEEAVSGAECPECGFQQVRDR